MGDTSRKVKNPLLTAAGVGFPFEDFSGNAVLMPVTPATSSVLQDVSEGEIASFVGQTQQNISSNFSPVTNTVHNEPRQQHLANVIPSQNQTQQNVVAATSEICLEPINPQPRDLTSETQPQKQGYLSSLLSSLPNISLASITGDREETSAKSSSPAPSLSSSFAKDQPPTTNSSEYSLYPGYYQTDNSYGNTSFNPTSASGQQAQNPHETIHSTAGNNPGWYSADNITPANNYTLANSTPTVVQPPPVNLPPTGTPSSSYRLGNQRRLKYAPPPDLATSNPRVNNLPANLTPQPSSFTSPPTTVLFQQQGGAVPLQVQSVPLLATGNEFNQNLSRESARASPSTTELVSSPAQNIPQRFSSRGSVGGQFEPATPQNTPANQNLLSNFVASPISDRDWSPTSSKTTPKINDQDNNVLREIDLNETSSSPASFNAPGSAPEVCNTLASAKDSPLSSSSPFAPISAARVSEKLEHLLATRKEGEVESTGSIDNPEIEEAKLTLTEEKPAATYFVPTLDPQAQSPSFYDPTKFLQQGQVNPLPSIPNPQTASSHFTNSSSPSGTGLTDFGLPPPPATTLPITSQTIASPTFYNPLQYTGNVNESLKPQQSSYPSLGHFAAGVDNSRRYFYSGDSSIPSSNKFGQEEPVSDDVAATVAAKAYFTPPSPPSMVASAVPEPTGSATLDPIQMSVNPLGSTNYSTSAVDNGLTNLPPSLHNLASGTSSMKQMTYRPVYQHWFHRKEVETKVLWLPFSMQDSLNLEEVHNSTEITPETTVATDGGRYDVDILRRLRTPVYWSGTPNEVRRCSWFYKGPAESRYFPYEENIAARLEEEFQQACNTDVWNRRVELNNGEYIVFHSSTVQVHYLQPGSPEITASWGNNNGAAVRPRVVKRGVDEFNIDEGEPDQVDHLLFLVHGIGSVCDLKFRSVEEVVDEFRSISLQLVQSHYRSASEQGTVNKIEVLPISWHTTLHSDDTGIDKKLQAITLESIPKLRHFTNDTLSDILFYTSPIYCQTIMQTVGNEMNRLHSLFKKRNPTFNGGVYVGGHSLGSLILFDLLCHQKPPKEEEIPETLEEETETGGPEGLKEETNGLTKVPPTPPLKRGLSRKINYVMGAAGTGQPYINYPQLSFNPSAFFALGSPIGMFVTVRGIDTLGADFALPTCPSFFNIFHPFDPVAYRVEALIYPDARKLQPKLIPHHKGRKRMHLELKETMARVGADLKQKLLDSVRSTWNSVYQLAMFHRPDNQALEREIDKVVEEQLQNAASEPETSQHQTEDSGDDIKIGKLNGGRRVDYVLQEAPFEYINEYIFALTSHVCYWESEDTMLMILKEIYGSMGIQSDAQLPQQTLTIERASPSPVMPRANPNTNMNTNTNTNTNTSAYSNSISFGISSSTRYEGKSQPPPIMGMDPTAPISDRPIGPPPTSGFLRKS